jgi:hypothetical protein
VAAVAAAREGDEEPAVRALEAVVAGRVADRKGLGFEALAAMGAVDLECPSLSPVAHGPLLPAAVDITHSWERSRT